MSLPWAAPRTTRSTASVSGRSASEPSRTSGGTSRRGTPVAWAVGCSVEARAGVGAQRPRVARGGMIPPRAPSP